MEELEDLTQTGYDPILRETVDIAFPEYKDRLLLYRPVTTDEAVYGASVYNGELNLFDFLGIDFSKGIAVRSASPEAFLNFLQYGMFDEPDTISLERARTLF